MASPENQATNPKSPIGGKADKSRLQIDEHLMTTAQVCERYEITLKDPKHPQSAPGISAAVREQRLQFYGRNVMTPPKQVPGIVKYLISLSNLFNVLLLVSGVLCFILLAIDPVENAASVSFNTNGFTYISNWDAHLSLRPMSVLY